MSVTHDIEHKIYHVEVVTPKQSTEKLEDDLKRFEERYTLVMNAGYVVCITDNPLGHVCFQATDVIAELGLPVKPGQLSVHLNTFHTRDDLHAILDTCARLGVRDLLVVSGDGNERLPRLSPSSIGAAGNVVTSVELVAYIRRTYPGAFSLGVAFNPYEPTAHEMEKLRRKIDAGAEFICTQPVLGRDERVLGLLPSGLPVIVECWMSQKLHLLSECVGYTIPQHTAYDPMENLKELSRVYPGCGMYLSMLSYRTQFPRLKEYWV